ncbi:uncharacterized protein APUU_30063A [Aspergillus puulaauensis]|uniref:Cytochrome P450 n=1 Tax=Aspergillus puulaauensis TaxID=1220207 RepID=A0A7R7XIT5_9EURO|nr:uncharacterized protein APUU_30063A [Aspergillus puulaauensis]BCS21838.1 hypothetical protein APUU_30063A [Aspergillus puulaauensis]
MFQYQRTYLENVLIPQFDQHGPTHDCNLLGTRFIFTAEPVNIKALFLGNFDDFEIGQVRRDAFKPLFGPSSVFITDGKEWRLARKDLRPFLNLHLDEKLPLVEEGVQKLFETIRTSNSGPNTSQASIEVKGAFRDLTANTVTRILTGGAFPTADVFPGASHNMSFYHACDIGMAGACMRSLGFLARPFAHRNFHTACEAAQQYILPIISKGLSELSVSSDKSQSRNGKQTNWLSSTYTQAITGRKTKDIAKEALAVIIAGTDSTASLLCFTILLLAQREEITISLRQSILERFGKDLTEEMSAKSLMAFEPLQNVIHEVLRLYPPVPISLRVAKESCTLPSGGGRDAESPILLQKGRLLHSAHMLYIEG